MSGESFTPQPINMFGGWVPNGAPEGLPNGMSWDCQDVNPNPAGVSTRDGQTKKFALPTAANVNYLKTYTQLDGTEWLLSFDTDGNLWKGTPAATPTLISSILAHSALCRSESQFGREYLAFSNGKWGIDLPRHFDGTYFDRVSQVGPGGIPLIADSIVSATIAAAGSNGFAGYATAVQGASQSGETVTITVSTGTIPPYLQAGDIASISSGAALTILSVDAANDQFTYAAPAGSSLPAVGESVEFNLAAVILTTDTQSSFPLGSSVVVSGVAEASYNGTYTVRAVGATGTDALYLATTSILPDVISGSGTVAIGGNITAGTHQVSVSFVTRSGYWTRPSPPVTWTAAGGYPALLQNIPIGPSNVVARVIMFTSAGQSGAPSFYTIAPGSTPSTSPSAMYINDNTTTSVTVDFSDTDLLAGTSCEYLFNLIELPEQAGVIAYKNRLFWWGERNGIWGGKNGAWLNLTFDGGWSGAVPLGWAAGSGATGGSAGTDLGVFLDAYKITGDGATGTVGLIYQAAVEDYNDVALISPSTAYGIRVRLAGSGLTQGTLHIRLYSASTTIADAGLAVACSDLASTFAEFTGTLTAGLDSIPSDLQLQVYADGTPTNAGYFLVDNIEIYETSLGDSMGSILRCSLVNAPDSYDGVSGLMSVAPSDGQRITNAFVLRNSLYIVKERSFYVTADDGVNEPALWSIENISRKVGTPSIHGVAQSDESVIIAGQDGIYSFTGSPPNKLSQEIQSDLRNVATGNGPVWDEVNWAYGHLLWVISQTDKKRILVGAPMNGATSPNFVLDMVYPYNSESLADVTIFRRFKDAPLARSWAPWAISASCAALVEQADGSMGVYLGTSDGSGNVMLLDPSAKDDNGSIIPFRYATYFVNGSDMGLPPVGRKLFGYLRVRAEGKGNLVVAGFPVANRAVLISAISRAGDLATITTSTPHGLFKNQQVNVADATDTSFNGQFTILSVPSDTTFTFRSVGSDTTSSGGNVMPILGILPLSSPASGYDDLELPINMTGESLSVRFSIEKNGNAGDWVNISQRVEVYLKLDPWSPFGSPA